MVCDNALVVLENVGDKVVAVFILQSLFNPLNLNFSLKDAPILLPLEVGKVAARLKYVGVGIALLG